MSPQNGNGIKILANAVGVRLLGTVENRSFDASKVTTASVVMVGCPDVDYLFQTSNLDYICWIHLIYLGSGTSYWHIYF